MDDRKLNTPTYVSWIKVKGIHLLPPVITEKRRIEIQRYRQQAIKLEKRIKNCRELKRNLDELLNLQPLSDRPWSEITFTEDSHVEALGIKEKDKVTHNSAKTKIRKIKLSKDIIDVTQYDKDGIKIIYNDLDANYAQLNQGYQLSIDSNQTHEADTSINRATQVRPILQPTNEDYSSNGSHNIQEHHLLDLPKIQCDKIHNISGKQTKNHSTLSDALKNTEKNTSPERSPRPRLIRSNSYTLENPSPILLAHLEKSNKDSTLKGLEQFKELSFARNWSSLENNYVPFENSEYSSINTVYNVDMCNSEDNSSNKGNTTLKSTESNKEENINFEKSSPTIEVIQTDISVQQITVNTNDIVNEADNLNEENDFKHTCDISDPNSQLMKVLKSIPENYSKQIIELIQKQKSIQKVDDIRKKQFLTETPKRNLLTTELIHKNNKNPNVIKKNSQFTDVQQSLSGNTHETIYRSSSKPELSSTTVNLQNEKEHSGWYQSTPLSDKDKLPDSVISVSPSQSIYYSLASSDTLRPSSNSSLRLIDLEYIDSKIENEKCDSSELSRKEFYIEDEFIKKMNVSRELFPQIDIVTMNTIKQEWAASIIGAHVKGFLTRRLLKTERVQTLINTIKDALMCALQLHNAENIDESDVELHRRLINQVSAACYAFHDIFFSLSVQEQMAMISIDRLRKIEKAKRPTSASSSRRSRSSSSRPSPKQKIQHHSQSLTKV